MKINIEEELLQDSLGGLFLALQRDGLSHLYVKHNEEGLIELSDEVDVFCVSCFDHYLDEEEFSNAEFVAYCDAEKSTNSVKKKIEEVFNNFLSFYEQLFELNNGVVYLDHFFTEKTDSIDLYKKYVIQGLKEMPRIDILFANLRIYSSFGFDFTHTICVKNNPEIVMKVKKMVKQCNLFILPY